MDDRRVGERGAGVGPFVADSTLSAESPAPLLDADEAGVRDALEHGEYLAAFERARAIVAAGDAGVTVRWLGVLALARAGSTERARRFFGDWELDSVAEVQDPQRVEDLLALSARIAKDAAVEAEAPDRAARCAEAAANYEVIWDRLGRPYSGVNAATMWLMAGERTRSSELAHRVELVAAGSTAVSAVDRFWRWATLAECALIEDRVEEASEYLGRADRCGLADLSARASTRRQFLMICHHLGLPASLLDELPVPGIVHYTGHMAGPTGGRFPVDGEDDLRRRIAAELAERSVGFGYGSAGAGADIVVAEELLARGADLHLFIPCSREAFVAASVAPAGRGWTARFERVLSAAASVAYATEEIDATDPTLLLFNAQVAMGSARLQAHHLVTEPRQLAVWDQTADAAGAGTGSEVRFWQAAGLGTDVVAVPQTAHAPTARATPGRRQVCSVLVGDFKGFGRLRDDQIGSFVEQVVARVAEVLNGYGTVVLDRNTWGDGLTVLIGDPVAAARCALDIQRVVAGVELAAHGLPADLGLRVSLHAGPMLAMDDPVRGRPSYFGAQITRAARIEPTTPEGDVYVTEAFAALLALTDHEGISCQYVGREATAKGYGIMALYLLRGGEG